jgi:uncharacterized membrane protein
LAYIFGWSLALFGAFSLQDWGSLIGTVCVIATAFISRHYKKKMLAEIRKHPIKESLHEKIGD